VPAGAGTNLMAGPQARLAYPNVLIADLLTIYMSAHESNVIGGNVLNNMVHMHADPCGYVEISTSICSNLNTFNRPFPDQKTALRAFGSTKTPWTFNASSRVSQISSPVRLLAGHVARALTLGVYAVFRPAAGPPGDLFGRYSYTAGAGYKGVTFEKSFVDSTYSPGAAFGTAVAARLAAFQPSYIDYGGLRMNSTRGDDSCWVREKLRDVWTAVSPALIPIAEATAGAACAPYGMSGVCAGAVDLVAQTANSYMGIRAAGIETYKSKVRAIEYDDGPPASAREDRAFENKARMQRRTPKL